MKLKKLLRFLNYKVNFNYLFEIYFLRYTIILKLKICLEIDYEILILKTDHKI